MSHHEDNGTHAGEISHVLSKLMATFFQWQSKYKFQFVLCPFLDILIYNVKRVQFYEPFAYSWTFNRQSGSRSYIPSDR